MEAIDHCNRGKGFQLVNQNYEYYYNVPANCADMNGYIDLERVLVEFTHWEEVVTLHAHAS